MIHKIKTQQDILPLNGKFPKEVIVEVKRVADILDTHYNSQGIDGGYILIVEDIADLDCVRNEYFDYVNMVYEFKDNVGDWASILYLLGTEYSVTLITPKQHIN